jgi:hypothetical protein
MSNRWTATFFLRQLLQAGIINFKPLAPDLSVQCSLQKSDGLFRNGHPLLFISSGDDFGRHSVFPASDCVSPKLCFRAKESNKLRCQCTVWRPVTASQSVGTVSYSPLSSLRSSPTFMPVLVALRISCTQKSSSLVTSLSQVTLQRLWMWS